MSQDDLSDAIGAASTDLAEKRHIPSKQRRRADTQSVKLISTSLLWALLLWVITHFSSELSSALGIVNQDSIDSSIDQTLGQAAQSVEVYYQANGELPDQLPDGYLSTVATYVKTSDQAYQLSLIFNGVVTNHHYQINNSITQ